MSAVGKRLRKFHRGEIDEFEGRVRSVGTDFRGSRFRHEQCDHAQVTPQHHEQRNLLSEMKLSKRGSLIIADNIIRQGGVIDPNHEDPRVHGVRRFNELVAAEPRVSATAIQTVGSKGYDGFAMALVIADP